MRIGASDEKPNAEFGKYYVIALIGDLPMVAIAALMSVGSLVAARNLALAVIACAILAQFWFDVLSRFSAIRLAIKPGSSESAAGMGTGD